MKHVKKINLSDIILEEVIRTSLKEQGKPENLMPFQPDNPAFTGKVKARQTAADLARGAEKAAEAVRMSQHDSLLLAAIVAEFIPVVGPFISAGIMLGDAALYAKEGNTYEAGLTALFAALPLIGPVARLGSKAISKLGQRGMAKLGKKVSQARTGELIKLNKTEAEAVRDLSKNNKLVKDELDKYLTKQAVKNSSKFQKMKETGKKALRLTLKDKKTRVAATIGMYVGAGKAYDFFYHQAFSIKPADVYRIAIAKQDEMLRSSIKQLDQIIAKRKKSGKLENIETTSKNHILEALPTPVSPGGLGDQILNIGLDTATVFTGIMYLGGALVAKWGINKTLYWLGYKGRFEYFKSVRYIYRGIKNLWKGDAKALQQGEKAISSTLDDCSKIISELGDEQLKIYYDVNLKFTQQQISRKEIETYYRTTLFPNASTELLNKLFKRLDEIEKTWTQKRTIGFQTAASKKVVSGRLGSITIQNFTQKQLDDIQSINDRLWLQNNPTATHEEFIKHDLGLKSTDSLDNLNPYDTKRLNMLYNKYPWLKSSN